jgi:5-hmdU DNA kinase, helical domain
MTWPAPIAELEPTIVFESYWKFIAARYEIYLKRLRGESPPWTADPVLSRYKFTNVFRATDRVSQEGIRISNDTISAASLEEQFFRILLFKLFNKIETWTALTEALGEEPRLANFDFERYDRILEELKGRKVKIYSAAYMMPCPADYGVEGIVRKHSMHLHMLRDMLSARIPYYLKEAGSLKGAFTVLRKVRLFGDFTAYQFTIDVNYGPFLGYNENEFIVPGPGAEEGIEKCFRNPEKVSKTEIIERVTDYQQNCAYLVTGQFAPALFGRPLQLIDVQNCFCEIAKYARVAHPEFNNSRTRIKHTYAPSWFRPLPEPVFPRQWELKTNLAYV